MMDGDEEPSKDENLTKEDIRRRRLAYFDSLSKENTPRKSSVSPKHDTDQTEDVSKTLTASSKKLEDRDAGGWGETHSVNSFISSADEFDQLKEQLKSIPSTNEEGYNEIVEKLIECSKRDIVERENLSQRGSRSGSISLPDDNIESRILRKRRDSGSIPCDKDVSVNNSEGHSEEILTDRKKEDQRSENLRKTRKTSLGSEKSAMPKPHKINSVDDLFVESARDNSSKNNYQRQSVRDSQETKIMFQKSLDLDHLDNIGLQTHRPDSYRELQRQNSVDEFIKNKSPRILNDVVSGELKYALGEKKYREFLEKSMIEIDQLQVDKPQGNIINDKSDRRKSENNEGRDHRVKGLPPKPRPKLEIRTERNVDLQNSKEYDENSDFDRSTLTNGTLTEITKTDFDSGQEPTRPLLNRPKYDPIRNVYHNSSSGQDLKDGSVSSVPRNYEQVTVPRNVVFSSSQIYQQAYKGGLATQSFNGVPGSPSMMSYPPEFGMNPVMMQQMAAAGYPYGFYDGHHSPYYPTSPPGFPQPYPSSPMSASVPYMHPLFAMSGAMHHSVNTPSHAPHAPDGGGPVDGYLQQMTNRIYGSYDGTDTMRYMKQLATNKVPHPPDNKVSTMDIQSPLQNNSGKHSSQNKTGHPSEPYPQQTSGGGSQSKEFAEFKNYLQTMPQGIPYPPPPDNVDLQAYFQVLGSQGYAIPYPMVMLPKPPGQEATTEETPGGKNSAGFEMKIPHPPPQKKTTGMSPRQGRRPESEKKNYPEIGSRHIRRHSQGESDGNNSSQRHIEGIRQHHEQKRYQQEEEVLLDKQRKFAKASIDRYFNSLENLYFREKGEGSNQPSGPQHNGDIREEVDESLKFENDTVVNTEVSGTTSVTAEGITDRMEKLGIDLSFLRESRETGEDEPSKESHGEAGDQGGSSSGEKLVVVCPECGEINKKYMTWCADCGEVLIGVEPVAVSKGSKARTKRKISRKQENRQDKNVSFVDKEGSNLPDNTFLQTGNESSEYEVSPKGKTSPNKSESRDSGRPSSEDLDFGRTEKEVIDMCETITDPVVKGFIKSYFNRKRQALEETKKHHVAQDDVESGQGQRLDGDREDSQPPSRDTEISLDLHEDEEIESEDVWLHERDLIQRMNQPLKGKKSGPIDIEVFTLEESRQSRNSSRMEPLVPSLNLINSSDEEDEEKPPPGPLRPMSMSIESEDWEGMFQPPEPEPEPVLEEPEPPVEEELEQPFLAQLIGETKTVKPSKPPPTSNAEPSKSKKSANKSKVRSSIESPGYQRHWQRSSIAWSSYHPRELSTNSSVKPPSTSKKKRPSSASQASGLKHSGSMESLLVQEAEDSPTQTKTVGRGRKVRPASADISKRKTRPSSANARSRGSLNAGEGQPQPRRPQGDPPLFCATPPRTPKDVSPPLEQMPPQRHPKISSEQTASRKPSDSRPNRPSSSKKTATDNTAPAKSDKGGAMDSPPSNLPYVVDHRLPAEEVLEQPLTAQTNAVSVLNAYSKYYEMTPRIQKGKFSAWLCLPDEILLHVFCYLGHSDLVNCALTCTQFHRVAIDETLWKYITVKKKHHLDDDLIAQIGKRHPASLALIQCHGDDITAKGLRDLFRECGDGLRELNFCGCSRGALTGDCILLHASARCHCLTHVDASWCHVTDSGIGAISGSSNRLECLCINGCQMVSDEGLETVIKKHGKSLRHLEMFGCFNITSKGMRYLANHCISLTTLNLGQCYKLTDSCITQLSASLGRVENLDLRGCKQIKDNCIRSVVKNCPRLKTITLANCPNITDVSMLEVSTYISDIRNIDVCGCRNITDNSIRALANNCQNLRNIDISSTGCTRRSVSMLANFCNQRLESVKLNFLSDVTDAVLIKLAKHCRRLKLVHLYGCTSIRNSNKIREANPSLVVEL